jgi:hypothetical protein
MARKGMGWIKLAQSRMNAVMNLGSTKRIFFNEVIDFVFETGLSTDKISRFFQTQKYESTLRA